MEYFEQSRISNASQEEALKQIEDGVRKYFRNRQNKKVEKKKIFLHETTIDDETALAAIKAICEGRITMGEANKRYEKEFSRYISSNEKTRTVSSNSGSSANLIAIFALLEKGFLSKGDKVLVPSLAWSTTVFPLIQAGLIPVFADQNKIDFNISIESAREALDKTNGVKAIMPIHTYGVPCDMDEMQELAEDHKLIIIEDTCESMGAKWRGRNAGSFGLVGTFSSYYSHHICTLEGGLSISDNDEVIDAMKSLRSHGWIRHQSIEKREKAAESNRDLDPNFLFTMQGFNTRISEPQAEMGLKQLNKLNSYIEQRQRAGDKYRILLENRIPEVRTQQIKKYAEASFFGMPIILEEEELSVRDVRKKMKEQGIETRPFLAGDFSKQPAMKRYLHEKSVECKVADQLNRRSFAVPCHQGMTEEDVEYVVDTLREVIDILRK